MRDPKRIDRVLVALRNRWHQHPDMRLGQLLVSILGGDENRMFYTEDEEWERLLQEALPWSK